MKKLFKIPALLIVSLLILTSCGGRSAEEDAKTMADVGDIYEAMEDAMEANGKKQIAQYEEVALDLQNFKKL